MQKRRKEEGGRRKEEVRPGFRLRPKPRAGIYRRVRKARPNWRASTAGRRKGVGGGTGAAALRPLVGLPGSRKPRKELTPQKHKNSAHPKWAYGVYGIKMERGGTGKYGQRKTTLARSASGAQARARRFPRRGRVQASRSCLCSCSAVRRSVPREGVPESDGGGSIVGKGEQCTAIFPSHF
jgi:hypothetical protein